MLTPVNGTPQAINDSGTIVGGFSPNQAFIDTNGTYTIITAPGNPSFTSARGVNNKGQVVGNFGSTLFPGPGEQGFVYSYGNLTVLDFPGASNTELDGINDAGQIVGSYFDQAGGAHGFIYSNGNFTTLDLPGGNGTGTNGINNSGQIALYHPNQSYIYANGVFTPIVYPDPQTSFTHVDGISNNGLLVGNYSIGNTPATQPFIATPIPEPAAAAVFGAGCAAAFVLRRRRSSH